MDACSRPRHRSSAAGLPRHRWSACSDPTRSGPRDFGGPIRGRATNNLSSANTLQKIGNWRGFNRWIADDYSVTRSVRELGLDTTLGDFPTPEDYLAAWNEAEAESEAVKRHAWDSVRAAGVVYDDTLRQWVRRPRPRSVR